MGLQDVANETECRSAALELGNDFGEEVDQYWQPKGCYSYGHVYWNTQVSAKITPSYEKKVCRSYGKY